MGFFSGLRSFFGLTGSGALEETGRVVTPNAYDGWQGGGGGGFGLHDGEKFPGGYGGNVDLLIDYWSLRTKSSELFERNLYARGIIRRLVTNIIATGLHLEATPTEQILGFQEGDLDDWTDNVEMRWELWAKTPALCDFYGQRTWGELQAQAEQEALVCGDVLSVLRVNPATGLPQVQLINGALVRTPPQDVGPGLNIMHGVELNGQGHVVAYWIAQDDGTFERFAVFAPKTGRIQAWLVFGTDKRLDEVRGQPVLSLILQSLKEVDRYRDSAQRKAVVNSMVALFVEKVGDGPGTRPLASGAIRAGAVSVGSENGQGPGTMRVEQMTPGYSIDRLAPGETIKGHPTVGADEKFTEFETGIIYAIAWALEIPPEILTLSFTSNFSASAAALEEFKMFLTVTRSRFGANFCQPFYGEWLTSEVVARRIEAPGFIDATRGATAVDLYTSTAWVQAEWAAQVKPSVDIFKAMRGVNLMLENGLISFDHAARIMTGSKWRTVVKKQKREREIAKEAGVPLNGIPIETIEDVTADAILEGDEDATKGSRLHALAN